MWRKPIAPRRLVRQGGGVQVLNEADNVVRRKLRRTWPAREFIALLRGLLSVAPVTVDTYELELDFAERYGSTYDAMIAAGATRNGCERLWSQDMQDGMRIGRGLRVGKPVPTQRAGLFFKAALIRVCQPRSF